MKIVFTTDQIYLHGGIEKVMAEKANYFADVLGYEVTIITTEQKHNLPCYLLSSKVKQIDIAVNYVRYKSYFHPTNVSKIPYHFKQWKKTLKEINPDVVIACNYAFDFYWTPFFLRSLPKLKEFHSSRSIEVVPRKSGSIFKKFNFYLNDYIESKYTKLIVLNQDETQYFKSDNLVIIPNPITVNPESKAKLINKKAIAAGRIAAVKGFENAILAWKTIVKTNPDWILDIYGQGEPSYIATLESLIVANGLKQNVFIKKAVSNLDEVLLDYSLYIMTSLTECFPMILLEALASGLPIVSYDSPHGPKNIITNNEDGFIVENQNTVALVDKISFLINNIQARIAMGKVAKQNSYRFATSAVMMQWDNLFKNF
jgi:glycosyltransferase involved in cell wall biosynthesis